MGSGSSPGGQPTPGKPIGLGGGTPALSGLVGQPKKALCAIGRKSKRKEKKGGGGKKGKDSSFQTKLDSVWKGRVAPLGSAEVLGGSWTPRQDLTQRF